MKHLRAEKIKRQSATEKPDEKVIHNTGPFKYSQLLIDFVSPYLIATRDFNDAEKLFSAAALAWNMAVSKEGDVPEGQEKMTREIEDQFKDIGAFDFLEELVERQTRHFSHHKILFTNVELIEKETSFDVNVTVAKFD